MNTEGIAFYIFDELPPIGVSLAWHTQEQQYWPCGQSETSWQWISFANLQVLEQNEKQQNSQRTMEWEQWRYFLPASLQHANCKNHLRHVQKCCEEDSDHFHARRHFSRHQSKIVLPPGVKMIFFYVEPMKSLPIVTLVILNLPYHTLGFCRTNCSSHGYCGDPQDKTYACNCHPGYFGADCSRRMLGEVLCCSSS